MAQYFEGIGRRKASTARVRITPGGGEFTVNEKPMRDYFTRLVDVDDVLVPLQATSQSEASLDISVLVKGGGVTGQSGAVKLGLARALLKMNPDLKPALKRADTLTRDPREKERKKPGLKKARKAPTYTKR
jgi:small subunit ribosomal protein S9